MVFVSHLTLLLVGFGLLVFFGDKLVDNAVAIAKKWNISSSVIAVTLLAAGTSAPELVTSFLAAYQKSSDISVGNVVGSNIFNLLAVGGLSILLAPKGNHKKAFFSWPFLLVGSALFTLFLRDFSFSRGEGLILLGSVVGFVIYSIKTQNQSDSEEDAADCDEKLLPLLLWTGLSLAGLIGGAQLALTGGVGLGQMAGLSERVIGITIISVGTGLPELATSVSASLKGRNDMAIANILGSNIYNTLGIPGLTATFFPLAASQNLLIPDTLVMLSATLFVGLIFVFRSKKMNSILGGLYVLGYLSYMVSLILSR